MPTQNSVLFALSQGSSALLSHTKVPDNVNLVIYALKGNSLQTKSISDIVNYHLKHLDKSFSNKIKVSDFLQISNKECKPEIYFSNKSVNNMSLRAFTKDEILEYTSSFANEELVTTIPIFSCGEWKSLSELLNSLNLIRKDSALKTSNTELHLFVCKENFFDSIRRKFSSKKKISYSQIRFDYSQGNNVLPKNYITINNNIENISKNISLSTDNIDRYWMSFIYRFKWNLSSLKTLVDDKKHLNLNDANSLNYFYGTLANYVDCADRIEDIFNGSKFRNNTPFFELVKCVIQIRTFCLAYLSDMGYNRKETHQIMGLHKDLIFKKLFQLLKPTFSTVSSLPSPGPYDNEELIKSVLAKWHSGKFVYQDHFEGMAKKDVEVLKKQLGVKRVIGYTYRSDGFTPEQIKERGGFNTAFTRDDHNEHINRHLENYKKKNGGKSFIPSSDYKILKEMPHQPRHKLATTEDLSKKQLEELLNWYCQSMLSLSSHVYNMFEYKGFISTSTSVDNTIKWCSETMGGSHKSVYVMYQEGGYLLPKRGDKDYMINGNSFTMANEWEVAVPGTIDWDDIVAYIDRSSKPLKIEIRDGLQALDPKAYQKILQGLSIIIDGIK